MAENPSRTRQRQPSSEAPTPDKCQRLDSEGILRVDEKVELKQRAQRAATEWLVHEGKSDQLSLLLSLLAVHNATSSACVF